MKLKYVIYEVTKNNLVGDATVRREALIFALGVMHSEAYLGARSSYFSDRVAEIRVVSAGFCDIEAKKVSAYGESISLDAKSKDGDSQFLTEFLFGAAQ